ncbi:MAG: hypothetical protein AB1505_20265 [Candidatus Latescibacterota bacterium]
MRPEVIRRIRTELGARARLERAAASRYLAASAAEEVLAGYPSPAALQQAFRADRRATVDEVLPRLQRHLRAQLGSDLEALRQGGLLKESSGPAPFGDPVYLERVAQLALEEILVNPAAPPLLVAPDPEPAAAEVLAGPVAAAVVFDHPLAITHELYPLCTDAYVAAQEDPATRGGAVVGVHNDWLDPAGRALRAIAYRADLDAFVEAPLPAPATLAPVLLLCQSAASHLEVARVLERAGVPHTNRAAPAALADDKWGCYRCWSRAGVATPPTLLLERTLAADRCRQRAQVFMVRCGASRPGGWVVQPRHGTEGAQVTWVSPGSRAPAQVVSCWESVSSADDAILRPRVGGVCLPGEQGPLPFDLRLQVFCDGRDHAAESGYLQVAPGLDSPICSVGRGGRILPFSRLADCELVSVGRDTRPVRWGPHHLAAARDLAARAARALGPLGLAGVDVKLDVEGDSLSPTVLDLNPRPAGLLHADLLDSGEPGLGAGLWRLLAAGLSHRGAAAIFASV